MKGKTALVTGGTAGIGRAIAIKLAQDGATVALFGQNEKRGREVAEELKAISGSSFFVKTDVANNEQVKANCEMVLEALGPIYCLVNNAGITIDKLLLRMSEEDWDRVIAVNLKSCYNLSSALVRSMMKQREGVIINISSVIGLIGNAGQLNYAAAKAGMIGFTKALAKELAPRNIRVNAIAPGYIETTMTETMAEKQKESLKQAIPLGRLGTVEDIAAVAAFLAGSGGSYITGQTLTVDGGMVM